MSHKYLIGIDEVGRGCLAGPVMVVAFALPKNECLLPTYLNDSKKMNGKKRELFMKDIALISQKSIFFSLASLSPKEIDRLNISQASNKAAYMAFKKIVKILEKEGKGIEEVVLDGGLYLKNKKYQTALSSKVSFLVKTEIKADAIYQSVMGASVCAKVRRDKYMTSLSKKYPLYDFEKHKGYGTRVHIERIRKYGYIEDIHRKSFKLN